MEKSLDQALTNFKDKIADCIKSKKSISVITHIDCDGITSGSIISKALIRAGANCTVTTAKELNKKIIEKLREDHRDFHVIMNGSSMLGNMESMGEPRSVLGEWHIKQRKFLMTKILSLHG